MMDLPEIVFVALLVTLKTCIALSEVPHNLVDCKPEFRCENPNDYIITCTKYRAYCNVRCTTGYPRISSSECGAHCPPGHFVAPVYSMSDPVIDECRPHKKCPAEERVILTGNAWHDTICARPGEVYIVTMVYPPNAKTLEVLNLLAVLWLADMPDMKFVQLCTHLSPSTPPEKCGRINPNILFSASRSSFHQLYHALHELSMYKIAKDMFDAVVKPFMLKMITPDSPAVERPESTAIEVDVARDTVLVEAMINIPLDPALKIAPTKVIWWRRYVSGSLSHMTILTIENGHLRQQDPRCELSKNFKWPRPYDTGFMAYAMNISLTIKHPHRNKFAALQVELEYTGVRSAGGTRTYSIIRDIALTYVWKHKRPADCVCNGGNGLEYTDPPGPCSPTCVPYTRIIPGLSGTNNDWTLQVTYNHVRIAPWKSRVVYGVTQLNTKKYCLITPQLFSSADGPSAEAPAAPVDVLSCDVVLLEFQVLTDRKSHTSNAESQRPPRIAGCVTIPVAVQSQPSVGAEAVYIPSLVNSTFRIIRHQGWVVGLGVKLTFLSESHAVNPTQEELSAVLNWLSIVAPEVRTVVVDMTVANRDYLQLDAVGKVYGSRFELKPGFASTALSQLMITPENIAQNATTLTFNEGDRIYMGQPPDPSVSIVTATWKHNRNTIANWKQGAARPTYYRAPSARTKMDTTTGMLELADLIASDTGEYTVELNGRLMPQRYNLIVLPTIPLKNTLRELGEFVSRHGAFLELTNVRTPAGGCDTPNPHVWRSGRYLGDEHDLRIEAADAVAVKRSGAYVFDELSRLSNNRAGIIVSLPSSAYIFAARCAEPAKRLHRNAERSTRTLVYTIRELSALALDMAKWGVSNYGLGYLDHTFVVTNNIPTFVSLAEAVDEATSRYRALRYNYVRDPAFGDGGYSAARVNGVYKLEAGLFFRRVSSGESHSVKSFVSIPGVPGLEVGLSSDMNVGVSVPVSKLALDAAAVKMSYLPYGAETVSVNHGEAVVFVDRVRDVVCYHVPPKATGVPLRTRVTGVVTAQEATATALGSGCVRSVPTGTRYVRLAVTLPASTDTVKRAILDQMNGVYGPQDPPLSTEDVAWLSVTNDTDRYTPRPVHPKGQAALCDEIHAISLVTQCLRGYSACVALASMVGAEWPQGGTGYPAAVRAFTVSEGVLLKIVLAVHHGAAKVDVSCELEPFALSSREMKDRTQIRGYYQRAETPRLAQVSAEIARIHTAADYIARAISLKTCSADTLVRPEWHAESVLERAMRCVAEAERLIAEGSATVSKLVAAVSDGEARLGAYGPRLAEATIRVGASSGVATTLAVLINVACVVTLWIVCANARSNRYRSRKLQ